MLTVRQTFAAAAASALLATAGCQSGEQANQAANTANAAEPQTVPKLIPVPEPPMNREQLLIATLQAASAFAAGADDTKLQRSLSGQKFELRIRFGCDGPSTSSGDPYGWTFNEKTSALKVRATPALSPADPAVKAVAGQAFETVEGFWLRRPWMLAAACPSNEETSSPKPVQKPDAPANAQTSTKTGQPPKPPVPVAPPSQLVGIAQFFTDTGPRTMRRSGRPYEATEKLETGQPPSGGFDLVLTGKLVALPNGRVIACTRTEAGERPACLISVEFGTVAIERADTHEQLAQWGSG
jgi:hypothetical protein